MLAGTRAALVGFVLWLERAAPGRRGAPPAEQGAAPSTIHRRLAGVMHWLRRHCAQIDPAAQRAATAAPVGYRRRLAEAGEVRGRGQAQPADVRDVLAMSRACPPPATAPAASTLSRAQATITISDKPARHHGIQDARLRDLTSPEGLVATSRSSSAEATPARPPCRPVLECAAAGDDLAQTGGSVDSACSRRETINIRQPHDAGPASAVP